MKDIVERLREVGELQEKLFSPPILYLEAAEEIERLSAIISEIEKEIQKMASFSEFSNDVIRYAFQRGRVAGACAILKRLEVAVIERR